MDTTIKTLYCACCGAQTRGRQWHNRDYGWGLCPACVPYVRDRESAEDLSSMYGIEGVHYNLKEDER